MKDLFHKWLNKSLGAFISGFAHALSAYLSLAMAKGIGFDVPSLHWKQAIIIALVSGTIKLCGVLEKIPLPAYQSENFDTKEFARDKDASGEVSSLRKTDISDSPTAEARAIISPEQKQN